MIKAIAAGLLSVFGVGMSLGGSADVATAQETEPMLLDDGGEAVPLKACTGVELKVKNQYSHKIKVKKFEYQVDGKWKTEQVPNTEVLKESEKTVATNQSLGDAEGKNITALRVTFQAWCNNSWGGDYTKTDSDIAVQQCNSSTGKVYRFDSPDGNLCD